MNTGVLDESVRAAGFVTAHVAVAALVVLVMRRGSPVWGGRAAKASWVAFIVTFILTPSTSLDMRYQLPLGLVAGSAAIAAATGLGSRLSRSPTPGTVRQATLAPRRLFVARIPRQRVATATAAAVAILAVTVGGLTATGTTLVRVHNGATGVAQGYSGWEGGIPFLVAAAILLALTWWSLRQIEDRARVAEPTDTVLRVRDASRVLRATTFAMAGTGTVLLFAIGAAMNEATQRLRSVSETAPHSPWDPYQWVAFGMYVPAVGLALLALAAVGGSISSKETLAALARDGAAASPRVPRERHAS